MDGVALTPVDEQTLTELLMVAITEATADEVTPPLTSGPDWTEERQQWFRSYHREHRNQLDGSTGEATWAVVRDGQPVGSVRLKRTSSPDTLEGGIWLGRSVRGQGVGTAAIKALLAEALAAGAAMLVADTASTNVAAQTAMRRAGFTLAAGADGRVHGSIEVAAPTQR